MPTELHAFWLIAAVLHASKALLVLLLRRKFSGNLGRAMAFWGAGCLTLSLWFFLLLVLPTLPFARFPVTALGTLGLCLLYGGVTELKHQRRNWWWIWLPPLVTALVYVLSENVGENLTVSLVCSHAIRLLVMARIAVSFQTAEKGERPWVDVLASAAFGVLGLCTLGVIVSLLAGYQSLRGYSLDSPSSAPYLLAWILSLNVIFALFLMAIAERLNDNFRRIALHDPLTDLYNRRAMEEFAAHVVSATARSKEALSVFMIDIDHFKRFNDEFGHDTGDLVLKYAADGLRSAVRKEDYLARWGGDEFCVLLPGATRERAEAVAKRVLKAFQELEIEIDGKVMRVTVSIGIVTKEEEGVQFSSLVRDADAALYQAKAAGRRGFAVA